MGYVTPTGKREISCSWQCHRDRPTPSSEPGTDYAGPTSGGYGSPVYAPHNGTVVDVKRSNTSATGRYVKINLDDGRGTRTLHMSECWPNVGERVLRGQQIGKVGGSANGSDRGVGPHAHQTLWPNWNYVFGKDATLDFDRFVGDEAVAGYQRVVGANGANYRSEPKAGATKLNTFPPGTITDWDGWIHGDTVEGNNVWFRGRHTGGWAWSGGFTDPGTHDLQDLNPKVPDLQPDQRRAVAVGAKARRDATTASEHVPDQDVAGGFAGTFNGWKNGQVVEGNGVWFRGFNNLWYWSGGFEDKGTHNLADLNPVAPPTPTNRIVGPVDANVRATPWLTSPTLMTEKPNGTVAVKGYVVGAESVEGNAVWFVREDGRYMWSGGFTSQSTEGLILMATPPKPEPVDSLNNPAGLPEYTPVWSVAVKGLEAPLGFQADGSRAKRTEKGEEKIPTSGIISYLILHWTGVTPDQLYYFSTKNGRDSCPSYYFRPSGKVFELIRPGVKPASTGSEWNWRSIAVEMLMGESSPTITMEQKEAAAQLAVEMYSRTVAGGGDGFWDGAPIDFVIDRAHVIGHNEALPGATQCPGPDMDADWIVARAKEIWAELHPDQPEPTTVAISRQEAEEVLAAAEYTADTMRKALGVS
jgi:hypothetical protein